MCAKQLDSAGGRINSCILSVRGQKVILDADLAKISGVPTKVLNQAVKRNIEKFPVDFMFQIAPKEVKEMWSQSVTGPSHSNRSQIVTGSQKNDKSPRRLNTHPTVYTRFP